jgi:membrane protein implicated in regulation of membrane protease activity
MGTLVGALIVLVNGVTVVSSLGGLPWWLDLSGIAAIVVAGAVVAYRAWRREVLEARTVTEQATMAPSPVRRDEDPDNVPAQPR